MVDMTNQDEYREWLSVGIAEITRQLRSYNSLTDSLRVLIADLPPLDASPLLLTRDYYRKILATLDEGPPTSGMWRKIKKLQRQSQAHFARGCREWRAYVLKHGIDKLVPGLQLPKV